MKMMMSAAAAALALLAAAPALAQPYGPPAGPPPGPGMGEAPQGWQIDRRIDWVQQRISRGRADGSLDWQEARRVETELIHIRNDERMMRAKGGGRLSDRERFMLEGRVDHVNEQLHWLRHNDERRPW